MFTIAGKHLCPKINESALHLDIAWGYLYTVYTWGTALARQSNSQLREQLGGLALQGQSAACMQAKAGDDSNYNMRNPISQICKY